MKALQNKRLLIFGLAIVLVTMACGLGDITGLLPGSVPAPEGSVYYDDFSNPLSGWPVTEDSFGVNNYADGSYRISVNEIEYFAWSRIDESFNDASIEVQVLGMGQAFDAEAGIICRYQDDDNFYILSITADGFYYIGKFTDAEFTFLSGADGYVESSAINQGDTSNSLRADCVGSSLTFYVNGIEVGSVTDLDFSGGQVGLIAGTLSEAGADILFDDFTVYNP